VKLLVTGGAGYIGGVLRFADDLVEEVLDRDPNHALAADLRSTLP
jgi:nucleoside-diphosphate-sugar epimerase